MQIMKNQAYLRGIKCIPYEAAFLEFLNAGMFPFAPNTSTLIQGCNLESPDVVISLAMNVSISTIAISQILNQILFA